MHLPMTSHRPRAAFSLLEVMVAIAIFFTFLFAVMMVVSNCLSGARHLERPLLDSSIVASAISLTNRLTEGSASGDLSEFLGDTYNGCPWSTETVEALTNKLFAVHIQIEGRDRGKNVQSEMTILLYRPQSESGSLEGATLHR